MGRLWSYTKLALSTNPFIPAASRKNIAAATVEVCAAEVEHLGKTVEQRGKGCSEAKELMVQCEKTVVLYIKEECGGRCAIGSDIAKNREANCNEFLRNYYAWLSEKLYGEVEEIKDIPLIEKPPMPSIPSLPLPTVVSDIKKGAQITGLVVMLFVALLVYLMFVRGRGAEGITIVGK